MPPWGYARADSRIMLPRDRARGIEVDVKDPLALRGIVVPLLTPFSDPGDLDTGALRAHVEAMVAAGVHGVIADAGAGEYYHMSEAERKQCAEVVVDQVAGRVPVLVGVGSPGTRLVVSFARHARQAGADGLMLTPTYYSVRAWGEAVLQHYVTVSDSVDLPIMLYNNPFATQVVLTPDNMVRIVESANVPWIKLTTKQVQDVPDLLTRLGTRVRVFEAYDPLSLFSLMNGASGLVSVPANALPDLMLDLWRRASDRDWVAALDLHLKLTPLFQFAWESGAYVAALKELARSRGLPQGRVRAAFRELTDAERAKVHLLAQALGVVDRSLAPTSVA